MSNDTLLRIVRRRTEPPRDKLAIIGIDDFAFRRGQRYGTIVCDLERRRPVTLLPDREQTTSQAWLTNHPSIVTVARDRGGGYGEAIAKALPHADQVADRWHLMENASRAFLVQSASPCGISERTVGSTIIDPKLLTYAERLQYEGYLHEGYLRRQETNEAILELSKQGVPIKQIVKRTGHSRKLVRCVLRGQRSDMFRVRQSSLEEWLPWLDGRWDQGARNASALWREMRKKGFRGQIGVVPEWARRRRLAERADQSALARTPSARSIARLMTLARDDLSKSDAVLIAAIESNVPDLVTARTLVDDFQQMIRSKAVAKLDAWLEGAKASLIGSFANGVE
ncbi:transposase [Mesorhizobium sp. M0488]|uniref:transposase n=1 Tax=unclassified Mesorhizobium TaxID=325217 RepID=UPI00333658DC